jgi:hypothetical protein
MTLKKEKKLGHRSIFELNDRVKNKQQKTIVSKLVHFLKVLFKKNK